ncbi:MAG: hypothetical protein NT098_02460 [Candidatus Parcubacteria bacterium]|nr:hypothetical protein [Candidatus Parcubacteria bacterium]
MKIKLTKKEKDLLWGEKGPYSEAKIILNMRIMDDSVSRMMVEVEGHINPTTFRIVEANQKDFAKDQDVLDLLKMALYDSEQDGYLVAIGEPEELVGMDGKVFLLAAKKQDYLKKTILKMHRYVMEQLGLEFSDVPDKESFWKKNADKENNNHKEIPSLYF